MALLKRISKVDQIVAVYAVIASITYIWSLLQFFWNLPSWSYFSSVGEIFVIFTYMATVDLIESLLVLLFVLVVFFILPPNFVVGQFITKAVLFVLVGYGFLIYRNYFFPAKALSEVTLLEWAVFIILEIAALLAPLKKTPAFCKIIEDLADRFVVFLYLILPISVLAVIVLLVRNIF